MRKSKRNGYDMNVKAWLVSVLSTGEARVSELREIAERDGVASSWWKIEDASRELPIDKRPREKQGPIYWSLSEPDPKLYHRTIAKSAERKLDRAEDVPTNGSASGAALEFISAAKVSKAIGLSKTTVYDMANRGVIPSLQEGRRVLFHLPDVIRALRKRSGVDA